MHFTYQCPTSYNAQPPKAEQAGLNLGKSSPCNLSSNNNDIENHKPNVFW